MDYNIVEDFLLKLAQLFLKMDNGAPLLGRTSVLTVAGVCADDYVLAVFLYYIADNAYRRVAEYQNIANLDASHCICHIYPTKLRDRRQGQ